MRRLVPALVLLPLLMACGQEAPAEGGLRAAAAFYPLEFALERVGGDSLQVEGLTPPGAEPHDLELGTRQTARVLDADLVVHLGGFQPAVDEVAAQVPDTALDVRDAVELREDDPHVWLDPELMATLGDALAARLGELDPSGADGYATRAAGLRADLDALDAEFRDGLADCDRRQLVVSHDAFGYLAARYDLEQVGIAGLSPEAEPSPARLAEAARFAKANGVTTIFFETLVSPAVAETVADEVGARTAVLDPVEGAPESGDYLGAMRANLSALRDGLGCR